MGRKILFITTDQMRYDALGCNGGKVARTPVTEIPLVSEQYFLRRMRTRLAALHRRL
jgi:arylsulfatase A-like enzyme